MFCVIILHLDSLKYFTWMDSINTGSFTPATLVAFAGALGHRKRVDVDLKVRLFEMVYAAMTVSLSLCEIAGLSWVP